MNRIESIEGSLRCFVFGWLALIPVLGMGLAVIAMGNFFRVRAAAAEDWNPASRYLNWGFTLAGIGLFISLVTFTVNLIALVG